MTDPERAREWLTKFDSPNSIDNLGLRDDLAKVLAAYADSEYQRGLEEGEKRGMERAAKIADQYKCGQRGLCKTHTGGPHKIEPSCRQWSSDAADAIRREGK